MIVCLQMCSGPDVVQNLQNLKKACEDLPATRPLLLCLPESFVCFAGAPDANLKLAHSEQIDAVLDELAALSIKYDIWLAAGTLPLKANDNKHYAASLLFNAQGEIVAQYNKMHLFDVLVADQTGSYQESTYTQAGEQVCVVDSPFGKLGLSVCYDIRFAALYSKMRQLGAEIILVPSAFTQVTGAAHWHALLKARAIEQQCYVVAAAQVGDHGNNRHTYGHSLIVSPWGEVLAEQKTQCGLISYQADLALVAQIRAKMPIISHTKFTCELKNEF
ncbi:carbon-nitrogen hydrolase family protein [Pseudoalteromonas tunicata]|uniref:carbon-nitrogen hydrolase family protein n=1 Tax=Pseudoalteromonas tunicata TaxID=314281 RepID=UPI00273F05FF|nr:carbon-nitrogen hydrolase family protein [Pseudoalteromonas tunicata]MDP5212777.1 carbon-nitrogen hydrolase family protein [Pseudoalteromonas tunicata]